MSNLIREIPFSLPFSGANSYELQGGPSAVGSVQDTHALNLWLDASQVQQTFFQTTGSVADLVVSLSQNGMVRSHEPWNLLRNSQVNKALLSKELKSPRSGSYSGVGTPRPRHRITLVYAPLLTAAMHVDGFQTVTNTLGFPISLGSSWGGALIPHWPPGLPLDAPHLKVYLGTVLAAWLGWIVWSVGVDAGGGSKRATGKLSPSRFKYKCKPVRGEYISTNAGSELVAGIRFHISVVPINDISLMVVTLSSSCHDWREKPAGRSAIPAEYEWAKFDVI
ncbi:hypothetical protein BJ322DRAFT_1221845 [Thelephora terrestris]|uniref:Uncharacterized protein n=1 Tax=Thelephora terrestris TaxID=56493 RepID=A0A9P6H6R3_9AGAM|nr:hypothetical protein BJ322DRAFT_1221845 [Thelephora terrestris]